MSTAPDSPNPGTNPIAEEMREMRDVVGPNFAPKPINPSDLAAVDDHLEGPDESPSAGSLPDE